MIEKSSKRKNPMFILLPIFLFLLFINLVSAAPPVTQVSNINGYIIKVAELGTVQQNKTLELSFHVFNASNGVPIDNTSTACYIHLYNSQGVHIFRGIVPYDNATFAKVSNDWEIDFTGNNFTQIGSYAYAVQCNSTILGGFQSVGFDVTPTGNVSTSTFLFIILIIIALTFALGLSIKNNWIMFLGSIEVLFFGFWIIIYGVDLIKNTTITWAIGIILWGLSIIGMYLSVQGMIEEGGWK